MSEQSPTPIAVTGATGALGRRVVRLLTERAVPMRLVVRDTARAPQAGPGSEIATADFGDVEALTLALRGTRTVFLVSGHEDPARLEMHRGMVRAAAAAGVERVVYTSFLGASPQASFPYARDHSLTERAILDAGMSLTALRDSLYADFAPLLATDGVIRGPAADGRVAWVAREDVARLAAAVLVDDAHADRVYDVTGPQPLTLAETAAVLTRASGREVRYVEETPAEARASRAGNPDWLIEGWIGTYLAIATGELAVTSHTIEAVTGQAPMTLAELLASEPGLFTSVIG